VSSLYVHVPFCARKCPYCAFYSEAADGEAVNRYVTALVRELERVAPRLEPATIFFGGGTPSLLSLRLWERILRALDRLHLLGAAEWTVECNPATVSANKARLLRDFGVNRLSLGVQSLDRALLDRLGRVHSRSQVFRSFDLLRHAGFDNLNLDLMFAIPGQTLAAWQATLREALALGSEHLSCYEVIYEEDTPLFAQLDAGEFDVDEDLACAMYEELVQQAAHAGLRQYEVANFARDARRAAAPAPCGKANAASSGAPGEFPAFACRHNLNYWRGGDFFGLGPSATSYVVGVRTKNLSNTRLYCEHLEAGERPLDSREVLSPLARAGETAAFGLRVVSGWPFAEFQRVTGLDLRLGWADEMRALVARGWAVRDAERFRLTPAGLRFADAAAELFLRPRATSVTGGRRRQAAAAGARPPVRP
jgi:oxygen-independent coproporphyrinogen-3 oxidase